MVDDARITYALAALLGENDPAHFQWPRWLTYGEQVDPTAAPHVQIVPSSLFGEPYGTGGSLPALPLPEIDGIPLLFGEPALRRRGNVLVAKADVLASAYFLLTRYEEWVRRDVRDAHGRFSGRESLPYRAGFIDRPIVEEYGELLRKWAGELGIHLAAPKRRFSVLLTHDVDSVGMKRTPFHALRALAGGLLGRQPCRMALHRAAAALYLAADPINNFNDVIRLDRRLADRCPPGRCRSIYFFAAGGRPPFDGNYDIRGRAARDVVRRVLASDAGIGLHASYEAGRRPELLAAEHAALVEATEVPIHKNRHHYLGWREPEDGHALAAAGITWDSSLGYADVAGFRLGVCRPVPLFDPIRRCLLGIEEHPLIVMDRTLSGPRYMGLDEEAAFARVCKLAEATCRHRGEFVVLWHNEVLASTENTYHQSLYPRVLDHLAQLLDSDQTPMLRIS